MQTHLSDPLDRAGILARRESFPFYRNFGAVFNTLTDEEAGRLLKAVVAYAFTEEEPVFDQSERVVQIAFALLKVNMDASIAAYVKTVETNRENGKKGGRPRKNPSVLKESRSNRQNPDNENENDIENDNDCFNGAGGTVTAGQGPPAHKNKSRHTSRQEEVDLTLITDYFGSKVVNTAFHEFLKARKEQNVKNTPRAVWLLVDKLADCPEAVQLAAIKESIMNNWKGVFPKAVGPVGTGSENPFIPMCKAD